MDGEEPTQATQNALDPRRLGGQNSGFSDQDISDIVCILYPHSSAARHEVDRLTAEASPYIIGHDEAGHDAALPEHESQGPASLLEPAPIPLDTQGHAIILRLSSSVKSPAAGCAFGRNPVRCDVVFAGDPYRRVSNVHFRIYVNEYGNVMIEDQSTNGTNVDGHTLRGRQPAGAAAAGAESTSPSSRRVLSSGSIIRIFLHKETQDLTFRVRIPRREGDYEQAYLVKVADYFARHNLPTEANPGVVKVKTETTAGPVDIFKTPAQPQQPKTQGDKNQAKKWDTPPVHRSREWNGSGKYNKVASIGKGAFAVVYKVTGKFDGKPYAAKELEKRQFIKNGVLDQKVENEMRIMERVQHPNIVRYIENFEWDDRLLIIIMEYIPGGDLGHLVSRNGPLPEDVTQTIAQQLLGALEYLHKNNITHRDVKPDNILVKSTDPLEVKLTDFGLSKMVDSEQTFLRTFCGTLLYCAPEVYTEYTEYDDNGYRNRGQRVRRPPGQRYSHAIDIWSLGGVLFFCLTKAPPYPVSSGISYSELLHRIMTTRLDVRPLQRAGASDPAVDFLVRMLQRKPEHRATITELDTHPWLGGQGSIIDASQTYDDMTDDDDLAAYSQVQQHEQLLDEDRVADSMGEDNDDADDDGSDYGQQHQARQRLFGEVGNSAIGSSGVIPDDFLNLPVSLHESDFHDDSHYEGTPAATRTYRGGGDGEDGYPAHLVQNQSSDQLQSLVEDVASQSLGGDDGKEKEGEESAADNEATGGASGGPTASSSRYSLSDMTTSKRKPPPAADTSDEYDDGVPRGNPVLKRFKSEVSMEDAPDSPVLVDEARLLARVPPIKRSRSGRQIDEPVDKRGWWGEKRSTWHLGYPEMTQLQLGAFTQAAAAQGEEFRPGRTALWDLAMRYFPPTPSAGSGSVVVTQQGVSSTHANTTTSASTSAMRMPPPPLQQQSQNYIPATAPLPSNTPAEDPLAHEQPSQDQHIVVPVHSGPLPSQAVGMIESRADSCVSGISLTLTEPFASFGRHGDNTCVFHLQKESRVPKFAFRILLCRDDASDDDILPHYPYPWASAGSAPDTGRGYSFWISTKATLGIHINGHKLQAHEPRDPSGPAVHWARLRDGDDVVVWGDLHRGQHTSLTFRRFWPPPSPSDSATSAAPAAASDEALEMASLEMARRLDTAWHKAERRRISSGDRRRRIAEADADHERRRGDVARERERSDVFETRRAEAVEFLARQGRPRSAAATAASPASASEGLPPAWASSRVF